MTQVKCEELKGRPDSTASTLQLAAEEPEASDEVSREKSDPPQVTPGGLFAGVGEFLPTLKEEADSKTGLAINYRDDAMLRCVVNLYIRLEGELIRIAQFPGFQRSPIKSTLLVQHQLKFPIIT